MASIKKANYTYTPSEIDEIGLRARYISPETMSLQKPVMAGQGIGGGHPLAGGAADAPPQLTGGESTEERDFSRIVLTESGKVKLIPKRRGFGGKSAFVDWINYTFHESTLTRTNGTMVSDEEFVLAYSGIIERIFGYGITSVNPTGRHFYQKSYTLGDNFGLVCYGGQRNTLLTSISGDGLAAAKPGWEKRLHDFLIDAVMCKITRIDVSHDDYDGTQYSVDRAKAEFENGLFTCGGRTPDCEQRGNWYRPNGKGRTFYVGHRSNGKYARIFEKGKQLGDPESPWVRLEVEYKSVDRVIPYDIILNPGEYLAAAYPAFRWIEEEMQVIKTTQKTAEISYEAMCNFLIRQFGSALAVVSEIEGGPVKAMEKLAEFKKMPSRLRIPSWENSPIPLHVRILEKVRHPEILALLEDQPEEAITGHAFA